MLSLIGFTSKYINKWFTNYKRLESIVLENPKTHVFSSPVPNHDYLDLLKFLHNGKYLFLH